MLFLTLPKASDSASNLAFAKSVASSDTVMTLKRQLEKAERQLQQLQIERFRIIKTLEKIQKRPAKGASSTTELMGRPSV
jgi:hypothetical protein